jgi:hypothetical protein
MRTFPSAGCHRLNLLLICGSSKTSRRHLGAQMKRELIVETFIAIFGGIVVFAIVAFVIAHSAR